MTHHFTCAVCGLEFATDTDEVEANREYLSSGMPDDASRLVSACDDCYQMVMAKARAMGLLNE